MTDSNILEMAKLGDPQAIEFLMNQSLQSRGMQAKVDRQGDCLEVTLEAERVPNRQALTAFVQKGISNLGAPSIRVLRILGQQIGASYPAWMQELQVGSSDPAPLNIQPETGADLTVNQDLDSTLIQSLEDTTIQSREQTSQDTPIQSLDELIGPDLEPSASGQIHERKADPDLSTADPGLEAGLLGLGAVGLGAAAGAGLNAADPDPDLERADLSDDLWDEPQSDDFLQELQGQTPDLPAPSGDFDALDPEASPSDDSVLDFLNELTPDPALEDFPAERIQDQSAYLGDLANESTTEADFQELIAASSEAIEPMPSELWADEPEAMPSGEPDEDLLDFLNQPDPDPLPDSLNAADPELLEEPVVSEPNWLAELASPEAAADPDWAASSEFESMAMESGPLDYAASTDSSSVSAQQIEDLFAAESDSGTGFVEEPLIEDSYTDDLWPEQPPENREDLLQALVEQPTATSPSDPTSGRLNLDDSETQDDFASTLLLETSETPIEADADALLESDFSTASTVDRPEADIAPPDFLMDHDIEWDSEATVLETVPLAQLEPTAEFGSFMPDPEPDSEPDADQQIWIEDRAEPLAADPGPDAITAVDPAPTDFDPVPDAADAEDRQTGEFVDPFADPTEAAAVPPVELVELASAELAESPTASADEFWTSTADDEFEELPPDFLQDLENESPEFSEFVTAPLPTDSQPDFSASAPSDPAISSAGTLEDELNSLELLPPEDFLPLDLPPDIEPAVGLEPADSDWGRLELDDSEPAAPSLPDAELTDLLSATPEGTAIAPAPAAPANLSQDKLEQGLGDFREEFVEPLPDEFFAETESSDWQTDLRQPIDLETPEADDALADNPPDYTPPPLPPDPTTESREPSLLWALVPLSIIIGGVLGFMLLRSRMTPPPATPPSESPAPPAAAPISPLAPPVESPASPTSANPNALKTALERADSAVTLGQTAQSVDDWKLVASRWQQAIGLLETVPTSSSDYRAAQTKRAEYRRYLTVAQGRANQPIVAAAPLGTANLQTDRPSPGASPGASPTGSPTGSSTGSSTGSPMASPNASPTASPVAAVTCLPITSTATSRPVELSRLQFEPVTDRTQASPLVGCITNHTEQSIASVNLAYSAPPARATTGQLNFSELNPQQTVPFKSEFALAPETQTLTIAQISWTAAGASTSRSLSTSINVARTGENPG